VCPQKDIQGELLLLADMVKKRVERGRQVLSSYGDQNYVSAMGHAGGWGGTGLSGEVGAIGGTPSVALGEVRNGGERQGERGGQ